MANKKQTAKKKSLGLGWLILIFGIALSNASEVFDSGAFRHFLFELRILAYRLDIPFDLLLAAPILLIVLLIAVIKAARRKKKERDADTPTMTKARASAAVHRHDPREKSFTEPEAYCFSCEATGEDHFQRDRNTRIRQLDEWLKNGLIDRAEYQVLKERYENNL